MPILRKNGSFRDSASRRSVPEFLERKRLQRRTLRSSADVRKTPSGLSAVRHDDGYWIETGASPDSNERAVAKQLSDLGHDVVFRKLSDERNVKTSDFYIDDEPWELKTLHGAGKNTVTNALKKAKKQSSRVILEISDCPKPLSQIADDCLDKLRRPNSSIVEIVLLCNGSIERRLTR
nr:hypothetical protein [Bifidobacterium sp. DSM 109958]